MSSIASVVSTDLPSAVYRKITLRLLPFLTLCYMFAFLDRINIGFAKLQMQSALGFSDAVYGVGAGIFFIGYVLFEIPSNLLLPKIGARRTIARIMILWGLVSASMLFVRNAQTFYALRFLLGVFEAGFAPGMILYLTYWYPPARMARAMAIVMVAGPIGGLIGGPISSWAMTALAGMHGLAGWQWMFIVEGLPCTVLGVVAYRFLDNRPADARWLCAAEKTSVAEALAKRPVAHGHGSPSGVLLEVICDPCVISIAFCNFCVIAGIYTVSFWLPTILKSAGVASTMQIGLYSAIPYLAAAGAMWMVSRSSDRRRERRWHSALCGLVGGVTLLIASLNPSALWIALPAITVATAMMWASYTVLWAMPGDYLQGNAAPGGIAFVNVVGVLGGFVSPVLIGFVKTATGSLQAGLFVMVALLGVGAIVMLINKVPRPDAGVFGEQVAESMQ